MAFSKMRTNAKYLAQVGMVAALYASLTFAFSPISYGPVQVRISEALTVLPYVMPASVWGLFIGCFLANWLGGLGPWDIFAGSLCTLLAAVLTHCVRKTKKPWLAPLPPVLVNAFGVSAYLQLLFQPPPIPVFKGLPPYFLFVISVGTGELIACYVLGYPLLYVILRRRWPAGGPH